MFRMNAYAVLGAAYPMLAFRTALLGRRFARPRAGDLRQARRWVWCSPTRFCFTWWRFRFPKAAAHAGIVDRGRGVLVGSQQLIAGTKEDNAAVATYSRKLIGVGAVTGRHQGKATFLSSAAACSFALPLIDIASFVDIPLNEGFFRLEENLTAVFSDVSRGGQRITWGELVAAGQKRLQPRTRADRSQCRIARHAKEAQIVGIVTIDLRVS